MKTSNIYRLSMAANAVLLNLYTIHNPTEPVKDIFAIIAVVIVATIGCLLIRD